jgi:osmotically-inducible protein OsmY
MTSTLRRTDAELTTAVTQELEWVPGIDASHVGVSVTDGAVTLAGEVGSHHEKLAAAKATRVRGVVGLAQEIVVRGSRGAVNDADITRQAGESLLRAVNVPTTVKAAVHDHEITLTGAVEWQHQRKAAARAVQYTEGVSSLLNLVRVAPVANPVGIGNSIEAALLRSAEVEARHVTVHVAGGVVTLSGTVRTWTERRQVEDASWSAPGVAVVSNVLHVLG